MKKYILHLALQTLLGLSLQSATAAEPPQDNPGYLPLGDLQIGNRQPTVEVTLSGPVLKMMLQLPAQINRDDPNMQQVNEMLRVVEHIYVRVYEVEYGQQSEMLGMIDETSQKLEDEDWQRIVRVREDTDSNVDIHVKLSEDGENLNGLAIMAIEKSDGGPDNGEPSDDGDEDKLEFVIVNVVGNFNPAYLANIGSQMDIDYLDGVEVP
jgi:hypothetical protein